MSNKTLVLPRARLFDGEKTAFQGFTGQGRKTPVFRETFLAHGTWEPRGAIEHDPTKKHAIPYTVIYGAGGRVFSYVRATKKEDYSEERLAGRFSIGVGGHLDEEDLRAANGNRWEVINQGLQRELREEVEFVNGGILGRPQLIGYLNDDEDSVGQVHFGIVHAVLTGAREVRPRDNEILEGRLRTREEIETLLRDNPKITPEGWTKILLPEVWNYLER